MVDISAAADRSRTGHPGRDCGCCRNDEMFTKPKTVAGPAIASIQQDTRAAVVMVTPAFLGLLAFIAIPFLLAIFLSTQNLHFASGLAPTWMCLEQYRRILLDPLFRADFYRALMTNATFAVLGDLPA